MLKRLAIALAVALMTFPANARPDARTMTCAQAQALVKKSKAITLSTGKHTYKRFVGNANSCGSDQRAGRGTAPTKDNQRCPVGYICRPKPSAGP